MAKKTKAGGKIRKAAAKPVTTKEGSTSTGGGWSADDKYNTKFNDHKKSDGKFKPQRIAKKRG